MQCADILKLELAGNLKLLPVILLFQTTCPSQPVAEIEMVSPKQKRVLFTVIFGAEIPGTTLILKVLKSESQVFLQETLTGPELTGEIVIEVEVSPVLHFKEALQPFADNKIDDPAQVVESEKLVSRLNSG